MIGRPSDEWGTEVVALVVLVEEEPAPTADELRAFVRARLAGYKVPRQIRFVELVPRTPAGKADHRAAQAMWEAIEASAPVV